MPYLKTPRGLNWHYEVEGEGEVLLFLHGWAMNSRIWRQQIKYFSERYKVIAIDLPGHGKSEWLKVSLADMAADIEFLLQQLNCQGAGIVASSFGGLVALKLFSLNPELIKFFVFAGSQPKFSRAEDYPFGLDSARIRKLAGQLESDYPSIVNIFFRSLFTRHERESRRFKWIQTFRSVEVVAEKEALMELLYILEHEDLRAIFATIDRPMLFINGTEDYICEKDFYVELQKRIPEARFDWFERCGHFPFLSQPHEFNQAVDSFLVTVIARSVAPKQSQQINVDEIAAPQRGSQ